MTSRRTRATVRAARRSRELGSVLAAWDLFEISQSGSECPTMRLYAQEELARIKEHARAKRKKR